MTGFEIIDDRDGVAVLAYAGELIGTIKVVGDGKRLLTEWAVFEVRGIDDIERRTTSITHDEQHEIDTTTDVDAQVERLLSEA